MATIEELTGEGERAVVDPVSGLRLYELSHPWGHGAPAHPGFEDVQIRRQANHAEHGVTSQRIRTVMHTGTHLNAPHHLIQRAAGIGELPLERFFGPGVVVDCPKGRWELVTVSDLTAATILTGDIVIVVTGWHRHYADSQHYFAHAPGLDTSAANWLIERGVRLVGIDTANVDHPLATSLAAHRGGPTAKYLPARYRELTGRDPKDDFPEWNPAHRALLAAGVPTIENVGGDVDALLGRRVTFQALPWRWPGGDACPIRLVAITDPTGDYRLEPGGTR
jgi:kynurenine formamidase